MRTKSEVERDITEVQKDITETKVNIRTHQSQIEDLELDLGHQEMELKSLNQELQTIKRARPTLYVGAIVEIETKRYLVHVDGCQPYSYQLLLLKGSEFYFSAGHWNSHTQKMFDGMEQLSDYVYDHGGTYLNEFSKLYEEKS